MENNSIIWWIVSGIGGAIIALLSWALKIIYHDQKEKIKQMEQRIKEAEDVSSEIKENYINRFDNVNKHIVSSKEEIIDKIHKLELSVNANVASDLIKNTAIAVALALKDSKEK